MISKDGIISLLKEGKTRADIAEIYNIGIKKVSYWFKEYNINIKDYYEFRLTYNVHAFDDIDNEAKAYWLGFLFADGCVSYNSSRNCYCISLALKSSDIEHLKKFKEFLSDTRDNSVLRINKRKFNENVYEECRYAVYNEHLAKSLIGFGCIPKKSLKLVFPDLNIFKSAELVYDFLRGYTDGDGCLSLKNKILPRINILGTKEFLTGVVNYLPQFKKVYKSGNQFVVNASGNNAKIIANKLYAKATVYLSRKFEKFNSFFKYDE